MTDDELSLVMEDSFDKELKIVKKILLSDDDQRDVLTMELSRQKEESNSYVDEYYRRPNHENIDLYDTTEPIIHTFDSHNKLAAIKNNVNPDNYVSYLTDEMVFNHNYNYSAEFFNFVKWYMSTHELSDETKKYLMDSYLDKQDSHHLVALRNELTGVHLGLEASDSSINLLDNKIFLASLMNIKTQALTFKIMLDVIIDKFSGDFSNQLLAYKLVIAHIYNMADKYGMPREDIEFESQVNDSIENISRDNKYDKAVEGLRTLITDSSNLVEEYNKGTKEHGQR